MNREEHNNNHRHHHAAHIHVGHGEPRRSSNRRRIRKDEGENRNETRNGPNIYSKWNIQKDAHLSSSCVSVCVRSLCFAPCDWYAATLLCSVVNYCILNRLGWMDFQRIEERKEKKNHTPDPKWNSNSRRNIIKSGLLILPEYRNGRRTTDGRSNRKK